MAQLGERLSVFAFAVVVALRDRRRSRSRAGYLVGKLLL